MSQELMALLAGSVLSVAALAYVLYPLFFPERMSAVPAAPVITEPLPPDDAIEARVRAVRSRHRSCERCGVRPESDALFCSSCGRRLHAEPTAR